MPLIDYIVLALLGSTGVSVPGSASENLSARMFSADSLVQPSGGAGDATGVKTRTSNTTKVSKSHKGGKKGHKGGKKSKKGSGGSTSAPPK
jgi:hypothetical protein